MNQESMRHSIGLKSIGSDDDYAWLLEKAELALDLDHFCTTGEDRARLDRIKQAFQEANRPPEGDS